MRHTHGYEINYIEGKIIVTKSFLKEAGVIGSTAYTELAQVRKDYPEFTKYTDTYHHHPEVYAARNSKLGKSNGPLKVRTIYTKKNLQ